MATPDPEGFSLLAKVVAAGAAVVAPIGGLFLWIENRYAKKHSVNSAVNDLKMELGVQRGHIAKLFDKIAESETKHEERHRELLMHLLERKQ